MGNPLIWSLLFLAILFLHTKVQARFTNLGRIINGHDAKAKQFPYQVYFDLANKTDVWKPTCGGTIISSRIILTAAHCLEDKFDDGRIYFGAVNKSNPHEIGQTILGFSSENFVKHEEYFVSSELDTFFIKHDIAIIELPEELEFNEYIQPARLPDPNRQYRNEPIIASGWGAIIMEPSAIVFPQILQYYQAHIDWEHNKYSVQFVSNTPSEGRTSCQGDSGGPLAVQNGDGSATVIGVTSFGDGLCSINRAVSFIRVSTYLDWIKKTAGNLL